MFSSLCYLPSYFSRQIVCLNLHFFNGLLSYYWVLRILNIFWIQILCWLCGLRIFSTSCGLSFLIEYILQSSSKFTAKLTGRSRGLPCTSCGLSFFLNSVFPRAEVFYFHEVQFINFFLKSWFCYSKKFLPNPVTNIFYVFCLKEE